MKLTIGAVACARRPVLDCAERLKKGFQRCDDPRPSRLGAALIRLVKKSIPPSYRYDRGGKLRLISSSFRFEGVLDRSFNQIRQAAASEVAVTIRLLETLATIAGVVERPERKEAIRRQGDMIKRAGDRFVAEKLDQKDNLERYRSLKRILDAD